MYAANPGLVILALAVVAWRKRKMQVQWLALGAILMLLMSLGPRIYFDHGRSLGGIPNPVYLAAYWVVPLVNATIHSVDRFAVGLQLCLSMMAAVGVGCLAARWRPWVLLAVLIELIALSPAPWPIPMAEASQHPASVKIQSSGSTKAVLDIPFMEGDEQHRWFLGDIFLQQSIHSSPIPFQLEGHAIETVHPDVRANRFFQKLAAGAIDDRPIPKGCTGVQDLAEMGFGWLVWRPMLTPDARRDEFRTILGSCLSVSEDFGDRVLYQIEASP
jgi:hypothetical protein